MVERGRENSRDCDAMRHFLMIGAIVALLMAGACAGYSYGSQREFLFAEAAAQNEDGPKRCEGVVREGTSGAAERRSGLGGASVSKGVGGGSECWGPRTQNLGVIAMRRRNWDEALQNLNKAEKLAPRMAGVRLNMGLVEFRRGNYAEAISPLQSVLRDEPRSAQGRYLLGMCLVFTDQFGEAAEDAGAFVAGAIRGCDVSVRAGDRGEQGGEKKSWMNER